MATALAIIGALAAPGVVTFSLYTGFAINFGLFAFRLGLGLALNALAPKPKTAGANRGYQVNAMGSALDHPVIYGKVRVGGPVLYDESTGTNNKMLHRIIAVAGHEVESFDKIYIDDEEVTIDVNGNVTAPAKFMKTSSQHERRDGSGNPCTGGEDDGCYATFVSTTSSLIRIKTHFGTANQAADSDLVAESTEWTTDHKLSGIAYMYVRLEYDQNAFPNGVPTITAEVKGKKVYNPATSTTAWSDNPALCVRDYLRSEYGLEEEEANIDDTLVTAAANVCNQFVAVPFQKMVVGNEYRIKTLGNTNWTFFGATSSTVGQVFTYNPTVLPSIVALQTGVVETQRYTCNGTFTTVLTPYELLNDLLTSMGGSLWYSQGKWRMKPAYWTASVMDLDEDDLRSNIDVSTRHSRRDNFNVVRGTFRGSESNWQVTDYPPVPENTTSNPNPFLSIDGGQESAADVDLPFTDNSIEARRIARVSLESNRQQLTINASFGLRALGVQVGDNVRLTNTRFGWTDKYFQVVAWSFGLTDKQDLQVTMTLRETAESVYDEVADSVVYERDNTSLLSPFAVPTLTLTPSAVIRTVLGKKIGVLLIDVSNTDNNLSFAEVQIRKSLDEFNELDFTSVGTLGNFVGTERVEVASIQETDYDIRVRGTNSLGVTGPFTTVLNHTVSLPGLPPADVTNFTGDVVGTSLYLSWTPVADLDLAHYIIKYSPLTSGANYTSSVIVAEVPAKSNNVALSDAGTGTYFIKAVDDASSGSNVSVNAAQFITTSVGLEQLNLVETRQESPSFSGTLVDLEKQSSSFELLSTPNHLVLSFTGGQFVDSGEYYFSSPIDLGATFTSRLSFTLVFDRFDYTGVFDNATGLFDSATGLFDSKVGLYGTVTSEDVSVTLQLRHTLDDPNSSPTWTNWRPFSVADVTARAFEFRALLSSTNSKVSPVVKDLSVVVDMPDRVTSENDITFTGTTNVTYATPFKVAPAVGISLANLANGDRYTMTNKTRTGFTMNIFTGNSVSTNSVTLDYVAQGYGKEVT